MAPRRPDGGRDALKPDQFIAVIAAGVVALLTTCSLTGVIVMFSTDYLHNGIAAIPELGFLQAFVACIAARALLGTAPTSS